MRFSSLCWRKKSIANARSHRMLPGSANATRRSAHLRQGAAAELLEFARWRRLGSFVARDAKADRECA
ncbi:MAG: hypothetical protein ACXWPM_07055, partial [Bdellovibrionota bacterium]